MKGLQGPEGPLDWGESGSRFLMNDIQADEVSFVWAISYTLLYPT